MSGGEAIETLLRVIPTELRQAVETHVKPSQHVEVLLDIADHLQRLTADHAHVYVSDVIASLSQDLSDPH